MSETVQPSAADLRRERTSLLGKIKRRQDRIAEFQYAVGQMNTLLRMVERQLEQIGSKAEPRVQP